MYCGIDVVDDYHYLIHESSDHFSIIILAVVRIGSELKKQA